MDKVTSLFASDPLSSEVGQLIERATNGLLEAEDWALNMEICDLINQKEEGAKDAVKAMRKKLQQNAGKNNHSVELTLTVAETCVKNCGPKLHGQIASREFLDEMVKVLSPKNNPSQGVQERVLTLIQSWADAFRGKHELREVERVYQELRAKGVEFPAADLDRMAPIFTPARSVPAPQQPAAQPSRQHSTSLTSRSPIAAATASPMAPSSPGNMTAQQRAKLINDLEAIKANCSVLADMLVTLRPGDEPTDDLQLMEELEATCREMQHRLLDLIGSGQVQDEQVVFDMLKLNDDLNGVFLRYERHIRARNQAKGIISGAASPARVPDHANAQRSTADQYAASSVPPIIQPPPFSSISGASQRTQLGARGSSTGAAASNLIDFGGDSIPTENSTNAREETKLDEREQLASLFMQSTTVSSNSNATQMNSGSLYPTTQMPAATPSPFISPYRSTLPPITVSGYEAANVPTISAGISTAVNARAAGIDLDQLEANLSDVEQWLKQHPSGSSQSAVPAPPPRAFERSAEPREDANSPFGL